MSKEKSTFCDTNHEIRTRMIYVIDIIERAKRYDSLEDDIECIEHELNKISELIEVTQEMVEKMEDRMKQYKEGIEKLGFIRIK